MKNQLLLSTARSFTAPLSLLKAIIGQEDLAVCNYGNA